MKIIDELRETTELFKPKEAVNPIVSNLIMAIHSEARHAAKKGDSTVNVRLLNQSFDRLGFDDKISIVQDVVASLLADGFQVNLEHFPKPKAEDSYYTISISW